MKLKSKQALMILGGAVTAGVGTTTSHADAHADTVTVKKGDTTWDLAQLHKTSVAQIVKDNQLNNGGRLIYVGQTLQINADDGTNNKQEAAPIEQQQAPAQQAPAQTQQSASVANNTQVPAQTQSNYVSSVSGNEATAKAWIASRESGGNYNARNGQYIGKYQLSSSYLGGDYSPAHQEQVADAYVAGRYGSWTNAQAFWQSHGWY